MPRAMITWGAWATALVLLAMSAWEGPANEPMEPDVLDRAAPTSADTPLLTGEAHEGFLYGRVTMDDGTIYEGRLRFGGDEEALWSNYFNGFRDGNPWATHVPREQLKTRHPIEIFGIRVATRERELDLRRPFMAQFGDIARIEARGRDLTVTLRSGSVVGLDRYSADDFADGVRVWDDARGVFDLNEWDVRSIEFLPTRQLGHAPAPLYGTVRTNRGDFTGLIQWDREACLDADVLEGFADGSEVSLRFATIGSIARRSGDSSRVTLLDGREMALSGTRQVGRENRGVYVDDPRYGRVLVSWDAFQRLDLRPGSAGAAYDDFAPGRPLTGSVVTRSGRRLAGRLVYDLDESETTESLDAPSEGVDYTIPFALIASIVPPALDGRGESVRVTLRSGEELRLDTAGDLDDGNAGMLVFSDGNDAPEYVPWADVGQIDFERQP